MKWTTEKYESLKNDFLILTKKELESKYNESYENIRYRGQKILKLSRPKFLYDKNIITRKYKFTLDRIIESFKKNGTITKVSKELNTTVHTVRSVLKRNNITEKNIDIDKNIFLLKSHIKRKYDVKNPSFFQDINSESKAYILGFVMADGCVNFSNGGHLLSINIHKDDIQIVKYIKKCLGTNTPIKYDKKRNSITLKIHHKKITNDLVNIGCTPRKSLTLQFPNISNDLLCHFIRGYFDGDGTITYTNKNPSQCNFSIIGNKEFIEKLQIILIEFFGMNRTKLLNNTRTLQCPILQYSGRNNIKKMYNIIYNNSNIFLKRKKIKFEKIINYIPRRTNGKFPI